MKRKKKIHRLSKTLCKDISNATNHKKLNAFRIDKKTLRRLYWDVGLSQNQIGDIFGVTSQWVSREMSEFEIPTRKGRKRKSLKKHKRTSPNSYEQKIIDLCKLMDYPFKFVGNIRNVVDGKSPDFISSDDGKCIIETFSKYYHKKDYSETRGKFFEDRGFRILFLDDNDLNIKEWKERCIEKINMFLEKDGD